MDGNRRWAKRAGLLTSQGHEAGAKRLIEFSELCFKLGIHTVSAFAFSTENWGRHKVWYFRLCSLHSHSTLDSNDLLVLIRLRLSAWCLWSNITSSPRSNISKGIKYNSIELFCWQMICSWITKILLFQRGNSSFCYREPNEDPWVSPPNSSRVRGSYKELQEEASHLGHRLQREIRHLGCLQEHCEEIRTRFDPRGRRGRDVVRERASDSVYRVPKSWSLD